MTKASGVGLSLGKNIVKVVRLERAPDGSVVPVLMHGDEKPKRKVSRMNRSSERLLRRWMEAQNAFTETYLERHERSNRKKRNGFSKDYMENLNKARRKAEKKLKLHRIIGL